MVGLPEAFAGTLGYHAARCAPLAGAGPEAVIAAFGSITLMAIRGVFQFLDARDRFRQMFLARDAAVVDGLRTYAPDIVEPLIEFGPDLSSVGVQLALVAIDRVP